MSVAGPAPWRIGDRVLARGRTWSIVDVTVGTDCTAVRLQARGDGPEVRETTLLTPFDRPLPLEARKAPRVVRIRRWVHELRRLAARVEPAGGLHAAAASGIRLIPYQLEPALAVLRHAATRVLIADAVGLGKTIQAGMLLLELHTRAQDFRGIVLAPAGLREQWIQELRERFGLDAILADAAWLSSSSRDRPADGNPWELPGIYVASHDFVKRAEVLHPLEDVTWDLCVIDEAHAATAKSDRRAAADAVARRARRVVLLTATPHDGSPAEFDWLCRIGRIDEREGPVLLFRRSRSDVGDCIVRRTTILPVEPTAPERRMHDLLERYTRVVWRESTGRADDLARLAAIVLRKRALSSAGSLATSVGRRLVLLAARGEISAEQLRLPLADEDPLADVEPDSALAAPGLADARRERRWLAAIAEAARHAAPAESKTTLLIRLLRRVREPMIIFTEFRDTLARLERAVAATGRPALVLHGGMSPAERSRVQRMFNERPLALLATDAASEGLNLHAQCRLVIHYELPWSAARLEQRTGRIDRFGQRRRVHEIALVAAHTAERLVLAPLFAKNARARSSGAQSARLVQSLTESRIARLVLAATPVGGDIIEDPTDDYGGLIARSDLRAEAEVEAERLEERRRLLLMSPSQEAGRPRQEDGPIVAELRRPVSTLHIGSHLVYRIALSSRQGRTIAQACSVLALASHRDPTSRRTGRQLRAVATWLLEDGQRATFHVLQGTANSLLAATRFIHARIQRTLRERETAIRRSRGSTARRLVQAGLFDRRALKEFSAREARRRGLLDEADGRMQDLTPESPLAIDIRLDAILEITRRRQRP